MQRPVIKTLHLSWCNKVKMKLIFLILASVGCALTLTPEQVAKIEPISKECRDKTGATLEQVTKIRTHANFEDDPKMKKHALYIWERTGSITEMGDINTADIKKTWKKAGDIVHIWTRFG